MEGPSLYLAAEWLTPFVGKVILAVEGNTKIGKERLAEKRVLDIFSWGKHLVFQFDEFALRVHFLLYGSFEAILNDQKITGDYPKKRISPRLALIFEEGQILIYSSSLKYLETPHARNLYDFSTDIMSSAWDSKKALKALKKHQEEEIADVLLDQGIFSGVGNIIKNEVLFLVRRKPITVIKDMSNPLLQKIVKTTKDFSLQFYEWRKQFVLKKHYRIYRKSLCPQCGEKICRKKTGKRERISFFCPKCQK
ncbi:endonuclease [Candidatus Protochlamydia naegleriophila]|uniref:Endonuclease n=1 Tax=Candidatus Protochlamydia naegleriophila TaxID=389348 RepID=A0A0U5JGB3_9BACT|nr:endonuclease VIII [Candidatus Protochlamydia naegleriophila]CUI17439.1 endonuclease [Candidatus Protochlamydia naegleriophila]